MACRGLAAPTESPVPIDRPLGPIVEGIAALAAARGEHVRAAELLGCAHTLQASSRPVEPGTRPGPSHRLTRSAPRRSMRRTRGAAG